MSHDSQKCCAPQAFRQAPPLDWMSLAVSLSPVVRTAQHLTIRKVGASALRPGRDVVGIL